jgi:hypothetical protein
MTGLANSHRSNRFEVMILSFRKAYGEDVEDAIIALLGDARHWCDHHARSYATLDRQAYSRYLAEFDQPTTQERQNHDE